MGCTLSRFAAPQQSAPRDRRHSRGTAFPLLLLHDYLTCLTATHESPWLKEIEMKGMIALGKERIAGVEVEPVSIYLYYIQLQPRVERAYYYFDFYEKPFTEAELMDELTELVANAFHNGTTPPSIGSTLSDLKWRRKGHVVIAVDAGGAYVDPGTPLTLKGKATRGDNDGTHTFGGVKYAKVSVHIDAANTKEIEIIYSYNDMQSYGASPPRDLIEGETETFELTVTPKSGPVALWVPDSGGTNMGPPVPPPA
jgi:hypothetical protein